MRRQLPIVVLLIALVSDGLVVAASGCSGGDPTARTVLVGPDRERFEPVARVLVARCGTLDCHGSIYSNLRLYGYGGLRLSNDAGSAPPDEGDIRPNEVSADYEAVIALEPEKMSAVVLDHGAAPERLTFIRKGRGEEDHKGLNPILRGDAADRCILSWLSSNVDVAACATAAPPRDAGRD